MAGTSRVTASSDWLLHPSLVFKTFEDNLIKSPFSYGNTPHIVPEKIVESFVDQNGIRCYRVKWLDSWLTEQHVTAAFPHLITEYWINKPINDSAVDYQNYIVQGRALPNLQNPVTSSNVPAPPKAPPPATKAQVISETLQQISQVQGVASSTSITISQLFGNEANKEVEISPETDTNVVENNDVETVAEGGGTDFNVSDGLQLPDKVNGSAKEEEKENKQDEKFSTVDTHAISTDGNVPKVSENSMVFLFDKNGGYTVSEGPNPTDKEKSPIKVPHIAPYTHPFKTHLNNFVAQPTIRLPSMTLEHINQHPQQVSSIVQSEVTNGEKKPVIKRSPTTKQAKPVIPKEKIPVVCDICGKTISSRKNLRVHKTVKHFKNGSFACQVCGRKFALNRDLKRHMPLHTNERKYQCAHCGLQCKQPGHLTKHIRTHTEVMNWRCDCCFKNFKVQADLKEHCFTEHADIAKENLTCSVCKEKLKLPNSVYLHSLRHSGVREFQCEICKASFKLKQHMQVHMKTHAKPKEIALITCPICQREFKFKHTYRKHFSKHMEKTKEEYDENNRLRQEEKKRKLDEKRSPDAKVKKRRTKEGEESQQSASDGEESKSPQKRKQRKPERVCYEKELNDTKTSVAEKMRKLTCVQCELTFTTQALLKSHMKLHKLENKFNKTIIPRPISVIEGKQIDSTNFSSESHLVTLKLPAPLLENSKSDVNGNNNIRDVNGNNNVTTELNNSISQRISNAIAMSALTGFQRKESTAVGGLCGGSVDSSINQGCVDIGMEGGGKKDVSKVSHQEKELVTN